MSRKKKKRPIVSFTKEARQDDGLKELLRELDIHVDLDHVAKYNTKQYIEHTNKYVNIWVVIAGVIARKVNVEPLLSEIYSKDKIGYHLAREQVFGGAYTHNNFDIDTEIRIQKVLGVIAKNILDNNFMNTERLIKATYKQAYNYLTNRKSVSYAKFKQRYMENKSNQMSVDKFDEFRQTTGVLFYFLMQEKLFLEECENELPQHRSSLNEMTDILYLLDIANSPNEKGETKPKKELPSYITVLLEGFVNGIYGGAERHTFINLWQKLYASILPFDENGLSPVIVLNTPFQHLLDFLEIPYRNLPLNNLVALFRRYAILGISRCYLIEQSIEKADFLKVLTGAYKVYEGSTNRQMDFLTYFTDTLVMTGLANDLNYARNYMLTNDEVETIKVEQNFVKEIQEKDDLIAQLQQQNSRKDTEIEGLHKQLSSNKELNEAQKRIRELEKQLATQEDNSKELYALREYVFSVQNKEDNQATDINYAEALQDKNIVFIGGHDNWINYMKKVLPNALYLNADSNGRDYSRVEQPNTAVFVHTAYNNHGTYYKAVSLMKKTDNKLYFINNTNVDLIVKDIYEKIIMN